MTPAKTRSSNIELLRILAMFMIIIFHISDHCVKVQLTDTAPASFHLCSNGKNRKCYFHYDFRILYGFKGKWN